MGWLTIKPQRTPRNRVADIRRARLLRVLCGFVVDPYLRLDRVLQRTQARPPRLHQHGHVAGLVLVLPRLGVAAGDVAPREDLAHAGINTPLHHELVGLARLQEVGEVAALDALLPHPNETRVEADVVAGGAGAEHDHAAALHHE